MERACPSTSMYSSYPAGVQYPSSCERLRPIHSGAPSTAAAVPDACRCSRPWRRIRALCFGGHDVLDSDGGVVVFPAQIVTLSIPIKQRRWNRGVALGKRESGSGWSGRRVRSLGRERRMVSRRSEFDGMRVFGPIEEHRGRKRRPTRN